MKFGLKINGEFLQLPQGATLTMDQTNHLLNLNNELTGEYTLPLTVPLTDHNVRLLNNILLPSTDKNTGNAANDVANRK